MDEKLRDLMVELGNAINEALSESDRIAEAIGDIKKAGYDVFLILEATIGFNKREDEPETPPPSETEGRIKLNFTQQDQKFMRMLKISLDDPNDPPKK